MSHTNLNTISPFGHLNGDVLREIFIHCIIKTEHPHSDYYSKNISTCFVVDACHKFSIRMHPQLSVSKVCSLRRDVALRTHQLWDNICIGGELTEANLNTAREYLSRAKNLPVTIRIRHCTDGMLGKYLRSPLIDFMSTFRIRILTFHFRKIPPFLRVLPDLPRRSVADLESLLIYSENGREDAQIIDLNDTRYPKLAVVRTQGIYKMSSFNCRSLRIFDGLGLSLTVIESWDLLSHCPLLEDSRLWIDGDSRRPVSMPQIHLQRLRKLVLRSESEIPFSTFIEALSLPLLETLALCHTATWSTTAFQSLAHRSNDFSHLKKFHLADSTSIVDAGILLPLMPWLKGISLCPCIAINKVVFDDLALNGLASGSLTPQLQSLRVGSISNTGLFLDMLESRMKNAHLSSNGVPSLLINVELFDHASREEWSRRRDVLQQGIPVKGEGD